MTKSSWFSTLIEGEVVTLIAEVAFLRIWTGLNISEDEFLMELRLKGPNTLVQIRLGLVEVDGQLSLYFYPDEEVRAGLSVLLKHIVNVSPKSLKQVYMPVTADNPNTSDMKNRKCHSECGRNTWSLALNKKRV
ncbi:hypothetical protein LZ023_37250 (plasmid) [Pseudomonas silvicola]|nr:hypothetical protein LZ023_37250 [Pseudomonas silvicola]